MGNVLNDNDMRSMSFVLFIFTECGSQEGNIKRKTKNVKAARRGQDYRDGQDEALKHSKWSKEWFDSYQWDELIHIAHDEFTKRRRSLYAISDQAKC